MALIGSTGSPSAKKKRPAVAKAFKKASANPTKAMRLKKVRTAASGTIPMVTKKKIGKAPSRLIRKAKRAL